MVVVNAIIERKGAKTALVTTQGFRDVYEIGRINRPKSFNPRWCLSARWPMAQCASGRWASVAIS